ncbi:unnamed protein product [Chrysoparadoxa australica]
MKIGKYEMLHTIGRGSFGEVRLASNVDTEETFAIKVIPKDRINTTRLRNQMKREILILKRLAHVHVARLFEVLASTRNFYLVFEHVPGGDLFDRIVEGGHLSEDAARVYLMQLLDALMYCHSQKVAHRDIKPENILIDGDCIKLTDFGLANLMTGPSLDTLTELCTTCGTPQYCAPEVLCNGGKGYNGPGADVWSCGVVLFAMVTGTLPFDDDQVPIVLEKVLKTNVTYPDYLSEPLVDLLSKILTKDPEQRISIATIKVHPWMTDKK